MADRNRIKDTYVKLLAESIGKDTATVEANLGNNMHDALGVTSVELFPLLSGLEEAFDIELDYAGFITDVQTANEGIDYVLNTIG
ncbi:MAG: acyl carrier protein [Clostridia bacterium]|nr:acyl carrier protein [Clostridia bacterium]